jgi:hypothetical protein
LQVLGNNSKTVNNIKNLTWGKNDQLQSTWLLIYTVLFINFVNYKKRCTRLAVQ